MTSMPRAFATAISATLVVPQSTVMMTLAPAAAAASIAASDRPWPSSSRLGTYGSTATPNRRRAMVRIASPVSPSASKSPKTMTRSRALACEVQPTRGARPRPADGAGRAGRRAGRRTRRRCRRRSTRRGSRAGRSSGRTGPARAAAAAAAGDDGRGVGKGPAEAGFDHVVRMPLGAAPRIGWPGAWRASGRGAPDPRAARRASGGRDGGRPTGASRRAAGSPRRSTSRSPR